MIQKIIYQNLFFFPKKKSYQNFSKPIIKTLLSIYSEEIIYLSIDIEDKIDNKRVKNYYVNPLLLNFIFNNLRAVNLFLTVTDLNNNIIKKTKNIDKYIYYFHAPVSTTKNYTSSAFDNYDIIMCLGRFQVEEIRYRENLKKLAKKELIPTGYHYFDFLTKNINKNVICDEILIAPSWNKELKHFLNESFVILIDILIRKKFKVIFRPHPEHFKRSKKTLIDIENRFFKYNFVIDDDYNNIKSMERARCLITDSSGIAIEYMVVMKRPVLYLDEYDKIHNDEFANFSNLKTIDHRIRENFGYTFNIHEFNKIDFIINKSEQIFARKLSKLENFINDNYFNFGTTEKKLFSILKKL